MSLGTQPTESVPAETARVARAAFPAAIPISHSATSWVQSSPTTISRASTRGEAPGRAGWRLASVTVLQFAEGLSIAVPADAVRAGSTGSMPSAWALETPGFDASVLCEFPAACSTGRPSNGSSEVLLDRCRERGR